MCRSLCPAYVAVPTQNSHPNALGEKTPEQLTVIVPDSAIHHASSLTAGCAMEYVAGDTGPLIRVICPSNLNVCRMPATVIPAVITLPPKSWGQFLEEKSFVESDGAL